MKEKFEIGQIVNTYGIKGFLKVVPFTDDVKRFEKLKNVFIEYKGNLILMTIIKKVPLVFHEMKETLHI